MPVPGIVHRTATAFDGTRLAYQVRGDGPAVVFVNGLGGSYAAWRHQYALLGEGYRVICWDYRGLYRSEAPSDPGTLAIPCQVTDLQTILDAEGVDRAVLVGWSMGVQVAFEAWRTLAPRIAGIAALNGVSGRPFDTAFNSAVARHAIHAGLHVMQHGAPAVSLLTRAATRTPGLVALMQALGLVGQTLDHSVFTDLAGDFATLDFDLYARTFFHLGAHDASDLLPSITCPVLVLAGSHDLLTPVPTARALAAAIRGADLVVLEGGTHYAAIEYPNLVNAHLRALLRRIPWGAI